MFSIKYKLSISYIALILIPLSLFLVINTIVTEKESEKDVIYSAQQVLNQTRSYLEFKTQSAVNLADVIASNDIVRGIIVKSPESYIDNIGQWIMDAVELEEVFLVPRRSNPDISSIHLYMSEGLASFEHNETFLDLNQYLDTIWFRELNTIKSNIAWFGEGAFPRKGEEGYIYAVRMIRSDHNLRESIGVVRLNIPEQTIRNLLDHSVYTKSTTAVLINERNDVISASSNASATDPTPYRNALTAFEAERSETEPLKILNLESGKTLVGIEEVTNSDWKLMLITPYADIQSLSIKSRRPMLIIFAAILLITLPLSFFAALSAVGRIKSLIGQMRKAVRGDYNVTLIPSGKDEIAELIHNYNYLLHTITGNIDEKYALGKEIKNLELRALQAQINPHFLYNTLDLIYWKSVKERVPEISAIVEALSKFYKLSLSKGENDITIREELDHVKAYVQIQNMRFEDGIILEIDVPTSFHDYRIIKIVLQPIVENAILHGIFEKEIEKGKIAISGELHDHVITLTVSDDGVGMPEERAVSLLNGVTPAKRTGYGLKNINERIKLHYGDKYGLAFTSKEGEGTVVTITIPAAL